MIPEPTDAGLHRRLLIVKINHLAERINPDITPNRIADSAAILYRIPELNLNRSHTRWIADIVNGAPLQEAHQPDRIRLSQALAELEATLPPAPAPVLAPALPAAVITQPTSQPPSSRRRGLLARMLTTLSKPLHRKPTFSPEARRATAAIMACAPSAKTV